MGSTGANTCGYCWQSHVCNHELEVATSTLPQAMSLRCWLDLPLSIINLRILQRRLSRDNFKFTLLLLSTEVCASSLNLAVD